MPNRLWTLEIVSVPGINRPRLEGVSLQIGCGVTAVLGHSGAGKTTLLNLLVGLEHPTAGTISRQPIQSAKRLPVFWSPQDDGLWPHLSVREHLRCVSAEGRDAEARIDELLSLFDLSDLAARKPDSLSQGERSRPSVARALASDANVLVMDEPLVHVDPARVGAYRQTVIDWCRSNGISLVLASHSPEIVLANDCNVICLRQGKLLFAGVADELYYRPASRELAEFLGPANWLAPEDRGAWIDGEAEAKSCIRPEQLSITGCADSPFIVETARFAGSVAEVDLRHEQTQLRRRFFHRPAKNLLKAGDRVVLRLLLLLLACCLLSGCDNEDSPQIPVKSTRFWQLPPEGPKIPTPRRMSVSRDDSLYVLDNAGRVLVYGIDGKLIRRWNMPESTVGNPEAVLELRDGRVVVADTHYHRVVFFDANGKVLSMMGSEGNAPEQYIYPVSLAEDDAQNLYVCEYGGNDRIQKFSHAGKFLMQFGTHGVADGQFQRPSGIVWRQGKIYVADAFNNRIQVFSDAGEFLASLGSIDGTGSLKYPYDLCLDANERLMIVEYEGGRVTSMDLSGKLLGRFGSTGFGDRQFSTPWGLAVDSHQTIYIADTGNRRIVALER